MRLLTDKSELDADLFEILKDLPNMTEARAYKHIITLLLLVQELRNYQRR